MGPLGPPSSVQPRRVVSGPALRPSLVPHGGNREIKSLWRATGRGVFTMGIARLLCSQTSWLGMAPRRRPPRDQRPLPNKEDEDGDLAVLSSYSQARRPLSQLRLEGRLLLLSH